MSTTHHGSDAGNTAITQADIDSAGGLGYTVVTVTA